MEPLYIYSSENPSKYSLLHIADETGKPLCGTITIHSKCKDKITRIENDRLFANENEVTLWQTCYCSMCKKRLNKLLNNQ
jgi:hypothetical protein